MVLSKKLPERGVGAIAPFPFVLVKETLYML